MSITLEHWHDEYSKNKKYLNYEFYDVLPVVDLYEIDRDTGSKIFIRSTFKGNAEQIISKNPHKYVYLPVADGRLDEYLMPKRTDYSEFSFLKRILFRLKQIIKPSQNPNKIPFSRFERITILIGVIAIIIPVILFIIEKLFF